MNKSLPRRDARRAEIGRQSDCRVRFLLFQLRVKTTRVLDLVAVRKRLQIFERKFQGPPDFSVYSQLRSRHSIRPRCCRLQQNFPGLEHVGRSPPHSLELSAKPATTRHISLRASAKLRAMSVHVVYFHGLTPSDAVR